MAPTPPTAPPPPSPPWQATLSRPTALEARVPWDAGQAHSVTARYDIASPEGFGLTFSGEPGDAVHPIYKGAVIYAGCATGRSAPLGRIVVVRMHPDDGHTYDAVYGHLDPTDPLPSGPVNTDSIIGHFGSSVTAADRTCDGSDGGPDHASISGVLRDAVMFTSGEIVVAAPSTPNPSSVWAPTRACAGGMAP